VFFLVRIDQIHPKRSRLERAEEERVRKGILIAAIVLLGFGFSIVGEECPAESVIEKMTTTMKSFQEVAPLDFSTIHSSGALMKKDGSKISVCLSNGEGFTIQQLANDFVLPLKSKKEFIAQIVFSMGREKKITAGEYSPQAGYGKPFWVFAEVKVAVGEKGTVVSLGIREGTARIIEITADRICGTFDLRSKTGSALKSEIKGTFNVPLAVSKW